MAVDHHETKKWKGYGHQRQTLVNAKIVGKVGRAEVSGYVSYSDRAEVDYQDLSLEMLGRLGYNWDNISNNYALAVKVADVAANNGYSGAVATNPSAGTAWPAPFKNADDAYYSGGGLRKDTLAWLGVAQFSGTFTGEIKGYYHDNKRPRPLVDALCQQPQRHPAFAAHHRIWIERGGIFGHIDGEVGAHKLTLGGWWEHNAFNQARRYYAVASRTNPGQGLLDWPTNPFATQGN
jgi:iron complex outermembrane receptor protein